MSVVPCGVGFLSCEMGGISPNNQLLQFKQLFQLFNGLVPTLFPFPKLFEVGGLRMEKHLKVAVVFVKPFQVGRLITVQSFLAAKMIPFLTGPRNFVRILSAFLMSDQG
jgi:hypothetical protein